MCEREGAMMMFAPKTWTEIDRGVLAPTAHLDPRNAQETWARLIPMRRYHIPTVNPSPLCRVIINGGKTQMLCVDERRKIKIYEL